MSGAWLGSITPPDPTRMRAVAAAIWPILLGTAAAVAAIDPRYVAVAHTLGANRREMLRTVLVPSVRPAVLQSIRLALGIAYAGPGVGVAVALPLAAGIIATAGWRATSLDERAKYVQRLSEGLMARAGEIAGFTGIDDPYEEPLTPELILRPVDGSATEQAQRIIGLLQQRHREDVGRLPRHGDDVGAERLRVDARDHPERVEHVLHECCEPGLVEFRPEPKAPPDLAPRLSELLGQWTGRRWIASVSSDAGKPTLAEQKAAKADDLRASAEANPVVQAILKTFPGARIDAVRRKGEQASMVAGLMTPGGEEPPPAEEYPMDDDVPESEY